LTKAEEKSLRDEIASLKDAISELRQQHCTCVHYHWYPAPVTAPVYQPVWYGGLQAGGING
jgi:hypothetical protein